MLPLRVLPPGSHPGIRGSRHRCQADPHRRVGAGTTTVWIS